MNKNQNQPQNIHDMIRKNEVIHFEDKHFEEVIDFTQFGSVATGNNEKTVFILSPLYFKNCTFKKDVKAFYREESTVVHFTRPVIFESCHFEGDLSFTRAIFDDKCSFKGSYFYNKADFEGCTFKSDFDVNRVLFHEEVKMQNMIVHQHMFLNDAHSKENLLMQGLWVKGNFSCINSRTFGYVDLASCRIDGFFNGNYSQHSDRIVISNSFFHHRFEMTGSFGESLTIKESRFLHPMALENIKYNKREIRDNVELR